MSDMTMTEMEHTIARLQAQLAAATKPRKMTLKVSAKGAVSVYGFGKWPVTLYADAMLRLLDGEAEIRSFIEANKSVLSYKS